VSVLCVHEYVLGFDVSVADAQAVQMSQCPQQLEDIVLDVYDGQIVLLLSHVMRAKGVQGLWIVRQDEREFDHARRPWVHVVLALVAIVCGRGSRYFRRKVVLEM
jgi:hypothetical protein